VVHAFFGPHGRLAETLDGFEERPSQQQLSNAVAEMLREGGVLLAEAGTGTGKTLAYLLPAVEARGHLDGHQEPAGAGG